MAGRRWSLKVKISVFVALIILAVMTAISLPFGWRQEQTMVEAMRQRAAKIAQMVGPMVMIQAPGQTGPAWPFVQQFIAFAPQLEENLLYIVIRDTTGAVRASTVNPGLLRALLKDQEVEPARQALLAGGAPPADVGPILPVEVFLKPEGRDVGVMQIGFSLAAMNRAIWLARLTGVGMTLGFLLAGIAASVVLAASLTRPITALTRGMARVKEGDFAVEVPIQTRDEIGELAQTFNFMTVGLRDRERIKDLFQRYVSKPVAERIMEAPISLTGERLRATVLFSDLRDFTTLAERLSPEEVVRLLNEYFGTMTDLILAAEGTLDKFIGDAIMAVWGAPVAHDDDPLRAVQTAIAMQRAMEELVAARQARGEPALAMGVGIATGEVVSGNIGSEKRIDYTVIGDTVNLASRLSGPVPDRRQRPGQTGEGEMEDDPASTLPPHGRILIDGPTYQTVQGLVTVRLLEAIQVKGKTTPVEVYEVLYDAKVGVAA